MEGWVGLLSDNNVPDEDSGRQSFDRASQLLSCDHCIVPVATSLGFVIVVIHKNAIANRDVSNW